jgi:hypothetical protein
VKKRCGRELTIRETFQGLLKFIEEEKLSLPIALEKLELDD